jgi:DNA polymerase-3 subunit delta
VARAKAAGVHLVLGEDSCLAEEALEELLDGALGKGREHSLEALRGDETTWARVVDVARTGSLFAERRAVVVRGAEALRGDGEEMVRYLDDPTPELSLILVAAKVDRRKGVWKAVSDKGAVRSAAPLKGQQLKAHVADRVKRHGLRLTGDGFSELVDRVGQDLQRLMGELGKLEAFAQGRREPLDAGAVSSVLGRGLGRPLYKLADAMTARRAAEALTLLQEMLGDGEPPLLVLGALHRAVRTARAALALGRMRVPQDQLAARLGLRPNQAFKVPDLMRAARHWSDEDLRAALQALDQADRRIKTGAEPMSALSAAVAEACRGAGTPTTGHA